MTIFHYYVRRDSDGSCAGEGYVESADRVPERPRGFTILDASKNDRPPDPPPTPRMIKSARYEDLRAIGWDDLTSAERAEARVLAFDLGEGPPPA